jgi:hypothetical protein
MSYDVAMRNRAPLIVAIALLILPVLYMGSYFALVVPGRYSFPPDTDEHQTKIILVKNFYRFDFDRMAAKIFWPLEQLDQRVRPGTWIDRVETPPGWRA